MSTSDSDCVAFIAPPASHQQQMQGFGKVCCPPGPECTLLVSAPGCTLHSAQHTVTHFKGFSVLLCPKLSPWLCSLWSLSPCCGREAIWFSFTRLFQWWRAAHREYWWNHCPKEDWVLSTYPCQTLWRSPRIHQVVKKLLFQRCNPFPADAGFAADLGTAGPPISHFLFLLFSLRN